MKKITKMMNNLMSKKTLYIIGIVLLILLALIIGISVVRTMMKKHYERSPIVSIEATNPYKYKVDNTVKENHFEVIALRESGKKTKLSDDEYEIDRNDINPYGESTVITITLKEEPTISCTCEIPHIREKEVGWYCGTPNEKDLVATVYSNGELNFSGTGDLMTFAIIPWQETDYHIKSITFDEGVEITSLNDLFTGLEELEYIGEIPPSVKYMNNSFSGCVALKKAAEWSQSQALEDISYAYDGCISLKQASALPVSVRESNYTYRNCVKLAQAPNMSQPVNIHSMEGMYFGCSCLATVDTIPSNATNMNSTFEECINLTVLPELPLTLVYANRMCYNCRSLSSVPTIPAGAIYMTEGFYGCERLDGMFCIESTPIEYEECFANAVRTSRLDLTGSCAVLRELAMTGNSNITVNGEVVEGNLDEMLLEEQIPDESLKYQDDTQAPPEAEETTQEEATTEGSDESTAE